MKHSTSIALLLMTVVPLLGRTPEPSDSGTHVAAISHGVKLSLLLPRRVYPAHALVSGVVRIKNVSPQTVLIPGYPAACVSYNPGVQVTNVSGQIVYPPPVTVPPPCPPPPNQPLLPGQSVEQRLYAVLDGPYVRAMVELQEQTAGSSAAVMVTTPLIRLTLVPSTDPHLRPHISATTVSAVVRRPAHARGLLYYDTWFIRCPNGAGGQITGGSPLWMRTPGTTLSPDCTPVSEWHVIAGWLNYPVATLDYLSRPGSRHG